eukprot:g543.t1
MWARGTPSQPLEPPGKLVKIFTTTTEHAAQHATHIDVTFPAGRPGGSAQPNASEDAASPARSETNVSGAAARGLAYIRFRNFYSHSVTVRQLMTPLDGPPEAARWSTLLADYRLMESAHHEDDAQAWHVLCVETDFRRGRFFPDKLTRLRFVVSQPSSMWSTSSLRNIECFEHARLSRDTATAHTTSSDSAVPSTTEGQSAGTFAAKSVYSPPYDQARKGMFDNPSTAFSSVLGRADELTDTLQKLRACKRSMNGNPGMALDFQHGVATAVRILPRSDE